MAPKPKRYFIKQGNLSSDYKSQARNGTKTTFKGFTGPNDCHQQTPVSRQGFYSQLMRRRDNFGLHVKKRWWQVVVFYGLMVGTTCCLIDLLVIQSGVGIQEGFLIVGRPTVSSDWFLVHVKSLGRSCGEKISNLIS